MGMIAMIDHKENNSWKPKFVDLSLRSNQGKARRYNKGKLRFELIPSKPLESVADVYTRGAHKYTIYKDRDGNLVSGKDIPISEVGNYEIVDDGANNWRKGMSWMDTIGSVKRHIAAWENGEEIDAELLTKHLANATWGLLTLMDYERTYPQGDDRHHRYLEMPKIGLDIDEVLCDWVGGWCERFNINTPNNWNFSYNNHERFKSFSPEELREFYLSLKPKIKASEIPFEPHCYITSRSVSVEITKEWLYSNGFPTVPVHSIGWGESKVEIAKNSGIEWFIDDRYENFVELNKAGICTFLLDAPWNRRYKVGYKRIKNFEDFKERFL